MPARPEPETRLCPPFGHKPASRPDLLVAERAAGQWGVLSLGELRECGLSRRMVSDRERRGWLHRLYRAVYAVGYPNPPREGWLLAAVKACGPTAVLSHLAAAQLWRLMKRLDRGPDVLVPGTGSRPHPGIIVHRTRMLEPRDLARRSEIPVTTPTRTVLDIAALLPYGQLRRAVREAQHARLVDLRRLTEAITRLGSRRGVAKLRRIIATGPAPTQSELEDVVFELLVAGGLEPPDVNKPMRVDGRWVVPDFRWARERLIVEADGAAWHDHKLAREDDAERQALLEAHGERVLRVTWTQAVGEPQRTLARIRAAGAPPVRRDAALSAIR